MTTETSAKLSPFDIAKNINSHGERLDVAETGYDPYMTNRIFANTPDSVAFANEMNCAWGLPKQMQYDFYRYGLHKNKNRYGKWEKRSGDNVEAVKLIKEAFGYSRAKALEVLPILEPRIDELKKAVFKGGRK